MGDQLPGQLVYIFVVSIIDAALLSWLTLYLYRRRVRRLMRAIARPGDVPPLLTSDSQPRPGRASTGDQLRLVRSGERKPDLRCR